MQNPCLFVEHSSLLARYFFQAKFCLNCSLSDIICHASEHSGHAFSDLSWLWFRRDDDGTFFAKE